MPELPDPKPRPHPWKEPAALHSTLRNPQSTLARYADLYVTSNFTFLTGGSHPDELVQRAAELGHAAIAITDVNSLAGVVRAHIAAKEIGLPLVLGCHLQLHDHSETPSRGWQPAGLDAHHINNDPSTSTHEIPRQSRGLMDSFATFSVLVYPTTRAAYGRLCRLLTLGKRRTVKGECYLTIHDVIDHQQDLLAVVIPPATLDQHCLETLEGLKRHFDDDRLSIAASVTFDHHGRDRLHQVALLAEHTGIPMVATNDVHYHIPERRALQDVLTCIKHGCTISQAGFKLFANAERHLKLPEVMAKIFADYPRAIARTVEIADRAKGFSLDQLKYQYPDEVVPAGCTPMQHLIDLTWQGAAQHYPSGVPPKVRSQIEHEFKLIDELNYAPYFLTVHDLVVYARSKRILCQGRGAAANSAVCYCLNVTAVDPDRIDLLFERFISKERNEPPDIDIDFEHERREEVIQYIYNKYGRDRAALTAEVISYRGRSAVREVGKALGLSLDCVDQLAKSTEWWSHGVADPERLREMDLNPSDPTIHQLSTLANEILGFPRHLSQHVGGFVITQDPLCESVPIENAAMPDRTVIEWDKDDIDALGMLKVDVLGLGMLTCISKGFALLNQRAPFSVVARDELPHDVSMRSETSVIDLPQFESQLTSLFDDWGSITARENLVFAALCDPAGSSSIAVSEEPAPPARCSAGAAHRGPGSSFTFPLELHTVPPEDPVVYDMICHADTIGVFQIESRAQMSMLPRLRPRSFYDLVIEVAIVRPGPIQGDMVHPYLRRRNGQEKIEYPNEAVERVLKKTLGVPLFQEQAMSLAIVAAGFTPGEADQLRRAIAAWKSRPHQIDEFGERLVKGMIERGYQREFAERCFKQIQGFSGYGFPESHAASFAHLVYVSAWLKCHHPGEFAAALINSQPMGFYAPAQIVRDAKEHGVEVRPIDVNHSEWDCTMEDVFARGNASDNTLRLGMRLIRGLSKPDAEAITNAVKQHGPFTDIQSLWRTSGVRVSVLRRLARTDAFNSMGLDRQHALWIIRGLCDERLLMYEQEEAQRHGGTKARSEITAAKPLGLPLPLGEGWGEGEVHDRLRTSVSDANPPIEPGANGIDETALDSIGNRQSPIVNLPSVPDLRKVTYDYASIGLSLRSHPIAHIRSELNTLGVTPNIELKDPRRWPQNRIITVAGLVLVRQRPSTANGIVFMTLEDETGVANLIVRPEVYKRCRKTARHGVVVLARGKVERQGEVVHVLINHLEDVPLGSETPAVVSRDFH